MSLPTDKNPFSQFGNWTKETVDQITVHIDPPTETTSNFTRETQPNARYWKSAVVFKKGDYESKLIKMNNCEVPYVKSTAYGNNYLYAHLIKEIGEKIVAAALEQGIKVTMEDRRAKTDDDEWWVTMNGIKDNIGVIDAQAQFQPKNFATIIQKTEKGARVNFDLIMNIKLRTDNKRDRTTKDVFTIGVDCSRGAIKDIKVDVEPPNIASGGVPQQAATRADVASQDLIDALDDLEL